MMRTLLVRGLIAGLIAGIAAAIFAFVFGEPHIEAAIAIEEANAATEAGHDHAEEAPIVSRDIQKSLGLLTANAATGLALGGLFSLAFAFVYGRFGAFSARAYSAFLAVAAFTAVSLVPFLKYPANPPAVGQEGTIASRTELYFVLLAISVIAAGLACYAVKVLAEKLGGWTAGSIGLVGYVAVMAACGWLLPAVNEVPEGFPATLMWDFRVTALGTLVVLWAVLGLTFGALVHRALGSEQRQAEPVAA
ncbi:MAG: hypothetical protein GEU86_05985 [Actinophytocola sp.]|nr:hypothetical protein [Actinophytocola sp.]